MKSRLLAILAALIIAVCAVIAVACGDDNPPLEDPPEYAILTLDEFIEKAEGFADIMNYIGTVKGYKFEFAVEIGSEKGTVSALLDIRQYTDIKLSANYVSEFASELQIPGTEVNLYLYNKTLYGDRQIGDGEIERDKIEDVNNDLTALLGSLITSPFALVDRPSIDMGEIPIDQLASVVEYFNDYLTISYNSKTGHYILYWEFTEEDSSSAQQDVFGSEQIDPFTCELQFYVKLNRVTSVIIDFDSDAYLIDAAVNEYKGDIDFPDRPELYEGGDWLDEYEEMFRGVPTWPIDFTIGYQPGNGITDLAIAAIK